MHHDRLGDAIAMSGIDRVSSEEATEPYRHLDDSAHMPHVAHERPQHVTRQSDDSADFDYAETILQLHPTRDPEESLEASASIFSGHRHARLGLADAMSLIIGLQVGSGIFSSPGVITKNVGSFGASLIVWIVSGLLALTGAISYAELASAIPLNGGPQAYLQYSFGPPLAYMFSFTAISALKPSGAAIISTILGEYSTRVILHILDGPEGEFHKIRSEQLPSLVVKSIAALSVFFVFLVQVLHARAGTRMQLGVTIAKIVLLLSIPILAIVTAARGTMPRASRETFGSISGMFKNSAIEPSRYALALYSGLWAFDGWDQCTFVGGELHNPGRDVSRAVKLSTFTVITIFSVTVISYFVVLEPTDVARTNSVALDFGAASLGSLGGILYAGLVAFSCLGALNGQLYTFSRLTSAAGREGFLPNALGKVNARLHTPLNASLLTCVLTILFIVFGSGFASLVNFSGVCSWFWYCVTVLGLLYLRVKEPELERPYQTWIGTPIAFVTVTLFLLVMPIFAAPFEALAAFSFIALGAVFFFTTQERGRESLSRLVPGMRNNFTPLATEETVYRE